MTTSTDYFTPLADTGLHLIPINPESKTPTIRWAPYMERPPTPAELSAWSKSTCWAGIACTRDLEVIDIDDPDVIPDFFDAVSRLIDDVLLTRTPIVATPRGGRHIYYYCDTVTGNQKLAKSRDNKTRIETRGPGGFVVAPTADNYHLVSGDLADIPVLPEHIRDALLDIARSFDESPEPEHNNDGFYNVALPDDAKLSTKWEADTPWEQILTDWTFLFTNRKGVTYLQRPGKDPADRSWSATLNHAGTDRLYVFSSNAPLPANRSYSKFQAWTFLEHGGDFKRAAQALRDLGYSKPQPEIVDWTINGAHIASDLGNSERFVIQHGDSVKYDGTDWYVWTGKTWERNPLHAEALAKITASNIKRELDQYQDSERYETMAKWAVRSEAASKIAAILTLSRSHPSIRVNAAAWNPNPWELNCRNGIVDLKTGNLKPHDRNSYCTNLVPIDYIPDADCTAWDRFLCEIMLGDQSMVNYLHRALGYSLTGASDWNAFFFCYGQGHNGKTTMLETVRNLLGTYATGMHKSTLMIRGGDSSLMPGLAKLVGKRFVAASEVTPGDKLDEGCVKTITGSDAITCRNLFESEITFSPSHHVWGMGNDKPVISGQDEGIWRRVHLIPFDHHFANPDTTIKTLFLHDEPTKAGILSWLVRGAVYAHSLIEQKVGLVKPERVRKATDEYRLEMDTVAQWLAECCTIDGQSYTKTKASILYEHYNHFTTRRGHKPFSETKFGLAMKKRTDFCCRRQEGGNFYVGIKLVDDWLPVR